MNARAIALTLVLGAALLLGYDVHLNGQRIDQTHAEISALLDERNRDIELLAARLLRSQILQTHLDECFEYHEDTLNSVERDPCRFVCSALNVDELWSDELDEAICGDLH